MAADRPTDRPTDRQTDHTDRQTDRQAHRQTGGEVVLVLEHLQPDDQDLGVGGPSWRQTDRPTDRPTDRQITQTDRQTDRHTDRPVGKLSLSWNISSQTTRILVSGPIMAAGGFPSLRGLPALLPPLLPDSGGEPGLSLSRRPRRSPSRGRVLGAEQERRREAWGAEGEAPGEEEERGVERAAAAAEGRLLLWGLLLVLPLVVLMMDRPDLSAGIQGYRDTRIQGSLLVT